jgi:glyoxylase-like metal-dependent hydrolase (beta-lactamase superfamily II)
LAEKFLSGKSLAEELHFPFTEAPAFGSTREVLPGILWLRMPLPLTLDHINLYLVDSGSGWYIIDTGLKSSAIRRHWEALFEHGLDGRPVLGVVVTHMHPDHVGQAGWLSQRWRVPVYMTEAEYYTGRTFQAGPGESTSWMIRDFYLRAGLSEQEFEYIRARARGFAAMVEPLPGSFIRLADGDTLHWGSRTLRIVTGQGHSPDHACLLEEEAGALFSGDQVIATISSNVSVMAIEPEANPLAAWLASLKRMLALSDELLVLPAHGLPFRGLHARLRQLIEHHELQLRELELACATARSAIDLLPVLFRRELDREQRHLALGECIAHLHYLLAQGVLQRRLENGVFLYSCRDGQRALAERASAGELSANALAGFSPGRPMQV